MKVTVDPGGMEGSPCGGVGVPPARQTEGTYIVHGVQQLGELEEALPGLAGVVGGFSHRTPELLDVIQPHLLERCLVLQTLFGNWGKKEQIPSQTFWFCIFTSL